MLKILFFLFSLLLITACRSDYSTLRPAKEVNSRCKSVLPENFTTSWYSASVDVVGKHLSGLLLIKKTTKVYRLVFTNEAGLTLFDLSLDSLGDMQVHHVIRQLDKKLVLETLRKDFVLLLRIPFTMNTWNQWKDSDGHLFTGVHQKKETAYFITSEDCASLQWLEWGSRRKRKVTAYIFGSNLASPDSMKVAHHTFNMDIKLKKLSR